jgi:hypothetical protein
LFGKTYLGAREGIDENKRCRWGELDVREQIIAFKRSLAPHRER